MKFKIRAGFIVHTLEVKDVADQKIEVRNSFPAGETVDFDEPTATEHLHKLEPVDKAADKFVSQFHREPSPPVGAPVVDHAAIASAVVSALLAAGFTPPAAAPAQ